MSKKVKSFLQNAKDKAQELEKDVRDYINNDAQKDIDTITEKAKDYVADVKEVFSGHDQNAVKSGEDSGLDTPDL